ncbi:hypothetical protein [Paenibacillus pini]|uniref:Uncharacterized protein n=1 Tax=Paenibacillus pini JCM 16418 TaxID=1236976 RepID=W7Z536_9BACL|nr:hypothetical protein [Paenibacillus pini]GAF09444.1 hypothetical protein JCM16418_3585 [Paenibacillus pini JCM 16418]
MSLAELYIQPFSVAEWIHIDGFTDAGVNLIAAGLAVIVFLWLYIRTARSFRSAASARLERLQSTLALYCRAAGLLREEADDVSDAVILLLEECKAAPLMTTELLELIDAYLQERDRSRLHQLQRALDREINHRIHEQATIIRTLDSPGWGISFWKMLKPAIPFAALAALLLWSIQLYDGLHEPTTVMASSLWTSIALWSRYISSLAATLSLYLVIMETRRGESRVIYQTLSLLISAVALLHFIGLSFSPYILILQLILFLCGFSLTRKRSRRERPYPGHEDFLE